MELKLGKLKNTASLKPLHRDIARAQTVLREKEVLGQTVGEVTVPVAKEAKQ